MPAAKGSASTPLGPKMKEWRSFEYGLHSVCIQISKIIHQKEIFHYKQFLKKKNVRKHNGIKITKDVRTTYSTFK
jgi:hypothetical protein